MMKMMNRIGMQKKPRNIVLGKPPKGKANITKTRTRMAAMAIANTASSGVRCGAVAGYHVGGACGGGGGDWATAPD